MKIVDTRNQACPIPIILVRKELENTDLNGIFQILCNNETSYKNLIQFLKDQHTQVQIERKNDEYVLTITKLNSIKHSEIEDYCERKSSGLTVVIKSHCMGDGEEEIGKLLMKAYISTLPELDNIPDNIVLYNSGVFAVCKDSSTEEFFQQLERKGTKIYICGTCINYYQLKEKIQMGTVSNMMEISSILAASPRVLYP